MLLAQNSSNQLMFRESGHARRLLGLLPSAGEAGAAEGAGGGDPQVAFLAMETLTLLMRPPSCASKGDRQATQRLLCSGPSSLLRSLVDLTCGQREGAGAGGAPGAPGLGQAFRLLSCLLLKNQEAKDEVSGMTVRWTVNHTYDLQPPVDPRGGM